MTASHAAGAVAVAGLARASPRVDPMGDRHHRGVGGDRAVRLESRLDVPQPMWLIVVALLSGPALLRDAGADLPPRPARSIGAVTGFARCGYSLTGNVSGVCPECGGRLENGEDERQDAKAAK